MYSPKVLVIPRNRWLRLNMTEKLFTGTLNTNKKKKSDHHLRCGWWLNLDFSKQGQLLEGVECHIYLYCFTFDDINLNRAFVIIVLFPKKI